jgi:molybdopterin synthase sulfur carrier subunit
MRVQVRLFASLRDTVGHTQIGLELGAGATAQDAWEQLVADHPALAPRRQSLAAAVNREYVAFDHPLSPGDEVVFIPPISGG